MSTNFCEIPPCSVGGVAITNLKFNVIRGLNSGSDNYFPSSKAAQWCKHVYKLF